MERAGTPGCAVEAPAKPVTNAPRELTKPPAIEVKELDGKAIEAPANANRPAGAERIAPVAEPAIDVAKVESPTLEPSPVDKPSIAAQASETVKAAEDKAGELAAEAMSAVEESAAAAKDAVKEMTVAATPAAPATVPEAAPKAVASTSAAEAGTAITFAVNSSFFGGSGAKTLSSLLKSLDPGKSYRIELSGAVGSDPVRGGNVEESRKYNRWMAERRVDRIAEWLSQNGGGYNLSIDRTYRENDPSRRVDVTAHPASSRPAGPLSS
ncbi:MAG: hypothetical protein R3C97_04105 [Geminicoccaceae bacterium]